MITSFAQFLEELQAKEAALLAGQSVTHAPTIGDMYEGLTRELLERAIPQELNLRLIDGFVRGVDGNLSHQTDAMLVMGEKGEQIPKTDKWIWPIEDVLAVFEVKKNLYAKELADSIDKMRVISFQQRALMTSEKKQVNVGPANNAFARIMGRFPAGEEMDNFLEPGGEILRNIAFEQLAPVRIVFGYGGYADEYGLREGFLDALQIAPGGHAGPGVLPNLIICRKNAIVKLNGHPFISPVGANGQWNLFGSTRTAPFGLLLELLWTRLANEFDAYFPVDDSLEIEAIAPLLAGTVIFAHHQRGWHFTAIPISKKQLIEVAGDRWMPLEISLEEGVIVQMALAHSGLDLNDEELVEAAQHYGMDLRSLAEKLVEDRLFSWVSNDLAYPISDTVHQMFTPDKRIWLSSNHTLLALWVKAYMNPPPATTSSENDPG
jgi:hypothetical protein